MNADQLLDLYDRVAESPDAIPRLRRFVLDVAVRGKLVEQDAADEPASVLLKRIANEKAQLVKSGKLKPDRTDKQTPSAVKRFAAPTDWRWVELRDLCVSITDGDHLPPPKAETGVPFLVIGDVRDKKINYSAERFVAREYYDALDPIRQPRSGDLLYTLVGSFGIPVQVHEDREFCVQRHIGILRPSQEIGSAFLARVMESEFIFKQADLCATGIAQRTVPLAGLRQILTPLPPLAEQHRIVAKVDELMALLDRLEQARAGREALRDQLTAATLNRLTQTDPAEFQPAAHFALQTLPHLTTRPDQINTLRQTILNLAVRGKLVEQDKADEPASELLTRVAVERVKGIKAGEIKKEKPVDQSAVREPIFPIPEGWAWVSLEYLSGLITKGSSPTWQGIGYVGKEAGLLFITSENVGNFTLRKLDDLKYVEARFRDVEPRSMLRKGDILMNLVGASIGRTAVYDLDEEANINQAVAIVRLVKVNDGPSMDYLLKYLNSDAAVEAMLGSRVVTAQPNISLTDVRGFQIPLPPLAEQHRIVARVDALMALCDQLEAGLAGAEATRSRLLDALLHAALSEPEAA